MNVRVGKIELGIKMGTLNDSNICHNSLTDPG